MAHPVARILAMAVFAIGLTCAAAPVVAQVSTFELSGVIRDEQGGVLPGVSVTVRNEATGVTRTVVSDANGRYYFANLPPQGTWELSTELAGFRSFKQGSLDFYSGSKPVMNLTLSVGELQETVTVIQEAPIVNTGQATIGLTVNKDQIAELPLNGRDYFDLALLGSGVSDVGSDNVAGSRSQTINGAYSRYTSYSLDGFNNTRDQHGVAKTDIPIDAMSEFRVLTNQFSAEYGETVGGIVTIISKSGTNQISGSGSLFVRPGRWDSPNPLTGVRAPFSRQDVAAVIGGPIIQNRSHYLVSYEYRNEDEEAEVTAPIDNGSFRGTFPVGTNRNRVFAKVDQSLNANNRLEAKFLLGRSKTLAGVGGLNVVDNMQTQVNNDIAVNATYTRLFSSNRLNEFRIGISNEDVVSTTEKPQFTPTGVALMYPGQGNLGSTNRRQTSPDKSFQIGNTMTWHTTSHTIKAGGTARSATPGGELLTALDGAYVFAPGAPYPYNPNNPASFPVQYQQGFFGTGEGEFSVDKWHVAVFLQDDWKISDHLTLNLGLRYQNETLVDDSNNLAPRVGFAWDLTGDSRTVLRGGAGLFHGTVFSTINAFEGFNNPDGFRVVTFAPGDPLFPQYPNNLPGPRLPAGVTPPPGNFYLEIPDYAPSLRQSPESYNFTIGLDRQLMASMSIALDFTYNRGTKLLVPTDVNAPPYFDYSTGLTRSPQAGDAARPFGVPGRPIPPGVVPYLPDGYPKSGYRDLYAQESDGESRYTAAAVSVNKRLADDFSLQGQYTWSRARNNGDGFRFGNALPLNPNDRDAEWGRSATDVPHAFSLNGVYVLPYDFQLAGIVRARSGQPVDPRVGLDLNGDRLTRERPFANGVILERNSFRAPDFVALDLGVGKKLNIGATRIEGRIEVFNVTNRLNPASVNSTYGPDANNPRPEFLSINSVNPGRQYQLSLRVVF
jgi:Carboxypeptidase regulatory-like domain/TonB dependent receptor